MIPAGPKPVTGFDLAMRIVARIMQAHHYTGLALDATEQWQNNSEAKAIPAF